MENCLQKSWGGTRVRLHVPLPSYCSTCEMWDYFLLLPGGWTSSPPWSCDLQFCLTVLVCSRASRHCRVLWEFCKSWRAQHLASKANTRTLLSLSAPAFNNELQGGSWGSCDRDCFGAKPSFSLRAAVPELLPLRARAAGATWWQPQPSPAQLSILRPFPRSSDLPPSQTVCPTVPTVCPLRWRSLGYPLCFPVGAHLCCRWPEGSDWIPATPSSLQLWHCLLAASCCHSPTRVCHLS